MTRFADPLAALGLVLTLAGCSFADDTLLPMFAGTSPPSRPAAAPAPDAASGATPAATPAAVAAAGESAPVGSEFHRLKADLQRLQSNTGRLDAELGGLRAGLARNESAFRGILTGIESERRAGAAPNDPKLAADLTAAEGQVTQTADLLSRLSALSARAASESTFGSYLLQSIRAAETEGGLSAGDRRQLQGIENDAVRAAASADRIVSATAEQIAEGSRRLAERRREVAALAGGAPGSAPVAAAPNATTAVAAAAATRAAPRPDERRPFVTIRFDRPDVAYETALRDAVRQARQRRPDIAFDVVAVTPPGASPESAAAAKRNVESVFRSLLDDGVPADRIRLAAQTRPDVDAQEVRLFVR